MPTYRADPANTGTFIELPTDPTPDLHEYRVSAFEDGAHMLTKTAPSMPQAVVQACELATGLWMIGNHEIDLQRVGIDRWEIAFPEGCKVAITRLWVPPAEEA